MKKGSKHSAETMQKMAEARKGKVLSEEHKKKLSEAHKGKTHSKSVKKKMSEVKKGEKNPMFGKHHTGESRKKTSEALRGKKKPKSQVDKMSKNLKERWRNLPEKEKDRLRKQQTGEKGNRWKGGRKKSHGYVLLLNREHPVKNRYVKRARLIAEKALGRYLKPPEMVHHVNGIRDDDRNENLLICTRGYHSVLENKMRAKNKKVRQELG